MASNSSHRINISTSSLEPLDRSDFTLIAAFSIIFIIGVIGNILVLYVFKVRTKKRLSTMERLILKLAIVDLLGSIFNPALFVYWQITQNRAWHFGTVGCKIIPTILNITDSVSIGIIVIIALDRCRVICNPFIRGYSTVQINGALLVVLCTAVFLEIPRLIHAEVIPGLTCYVPESNKPSYAYPALLSLLLRDVSCSVIFVVIFHRMYHALYDPDAIRLLGDQSQIKKRKAYVLLVVITIVFTVLVYPRDILHIVFLIISLSPYDMAPSKAILDLNTVLKILRAVNSIINVFIYARLHGKFRKSLKTMQTSLNRRRQAAIKKINHNHIILSGLGTVETNDVVEDNLCQNGHSVFDIYHPHKKNNTSSAE